MLTFKLPPHYQLGTRHCLRRCTISVASRVLAPLARGGPSETLAQLRPRRVGWIEIAQALERPSPSLAFSAWFTSLAAHHQQENADQGYRRRRRVDYAPK
ncbi:hypothetical protein CCHR01_11910 [Colletotrichum chrysophilum]|uniref:Uncharacterized protein n=1 Tax=Colletotrichum chrysophilum TaxID=1836956 RepID=A0AAD9EF98_9PEZI|nr:hypothetical protein K456DRAFT_1483830 [Colletotrichum gloeosporioides 23]KAK1845477.1 hypothetical protein CCHR01_11910 [Colletotrichum chrysophilum]